MSKFTKIECSIIKATAKNMAPFVAKIQKVDAQIAETREKIQKTLEERLQKLEAEKAGYQSIIDSMNGAVKKITGGYGAEELITIRKEGTGSMDSKTGKEIQKTVYSFKYPDTIIPPAEEVPATEGLPGSDYDIDKNPQAAAVTEEPASDEKPEFIDGINMNDDSFVPEEVLEEQSKAAEAAEESFNGDPFGDDPFNC